MESLRLTHPNSGRVECAPEWPAYRDAGAGPGSGHWLLLLLCCLTLDGLEVVERWGEIIHQPLPLELLLPLDRSRGDTWERNTGNIHQNYIASDDQGLKGQTYLFRWWRGQRDRSQIFQVLVGLFRHLVGVVLYLLPMERARSFSVRWRKLGKIIQISQVCYSFEYSWKILKKNSKRIVKKTTKKT